jgi:hypothetical protein
VWRKFNISAEYITFIFRVEEEARKEQVASRVRQAACFFLVFCLAYF